MLGVFYYKLDSVMCFSAGRKFSPPKKRTYLAFLRLFINVFKLGVLTR